ncbi:Endopolyphosphatase [Stygiomarasmius scandens]|uniref:Endopolyphosphatase n=1 Tax=Marasmiellus scandens TaxID=2682957 RepID=A0ABR1K6Y5_9AGAR
MAGHVPPSRGNYFSECYVRYVELSLRFQDTIVGHLYGHMNADHFFFLEAEDLELDLPDEQISTHDDLPDQLLADFANIPKAKNINLDGYAVINVSPPVVPNPYLPTFRVFTYNVTGVGEVSSRKKDRKPGHHRGRHGNKNKLCKEEPFKSSWKCHLNEAWHSDEEAPSRKNGLWSALGYAQYYLLDMDKAGKKHKPKFKLGYATYELDGLQYQENRTEYPIPLKQLPKSLRAGNRTSSRYTPYGMGDLTIGSWTSLARQLGDETRKKLRRRFLKIVNVQV